MPVCFPGLACGVGLLGLSLGLPVGLTVGDGLAVSSPPVKITRPATTSRTTAAAVATVPSARCRRRRCASRSACLRAASFAS